MREKASRNYGNTAMEVGIYANIYENQAGKRTLLGILIGVVGWFQVFCLFNFFL